MFLTRWQLLRLRKIRAARIEERRKADSLETSSINTAEVAERMAAARDSSPTSAPEPVTQEAAVDDVGVQGSDEEPVAEKAETDDEEAAAPAWGAAVFAATSGETNEPSADETAIREALTQEPVHQTVIRESIVGIPAPDHSAALAQGEYVPDPMTDTFERRGRHGLDNGPIDQDPPERATSDTGVIDLSGIRGGRTLPSRRALREARNKGEEVVVVDGQEFNTGLIPITRPRNAAEQTPTPTAPTSAPDDDASATGGWTSIMSGWLKDRQGGKQ